MSAHATAGVAKGRWLISNAPLMLYAGSVPASSLLLSILAARLLGAVGFSAFAMIWATVQTFSAVGQLSLSFAATRFSAQLALRDPLGAARIVMKCVQWSLLGGVLVGAVLLFGADPLANRLLGHPELESGLRLAALIALFTICASVLSGGLIGLPSAAMITALGAMQLTLPLAFGSIGALQYGLSGLLIGLALAQVVRLAVGMWMLWRWQRRLSLAGGVSGPVDSKALFTFAAPNLMAGIITPTAQWTVLASVGAGPHGLQGVALFAVANNVRNAVAFIYSILSQIFTVRINQAVGAEKYGAAYSLLRLNLGLALGLCTVMSLAILALGDQVFAVFGTEYSGALPVLRILLIAALLDAVSGVIYQYVVAAGTMWKSLLFIIIPRETCLLLIAFSSPAGGTEVLLAAAHCGAALVGLVATRWVAREGISLIKYGRKLG